MDSNNYKDFLRSEYWSKVRSIAMRRDQYRCHQCDSNLNLQVHHLTYIHQGEELDYMEDVVTLCRLCHLKEHGLFRDASTEKTQTLAEMFRETKYFEKLIAGNRKYLLEHNMDSDHLDGILERINSILNQER